MYDIVGAVVHSVKNTMKIWHMLQIYSVAEYRFSFIFIYRRFAKL